MYCFRINASWKRSIIYTKYKAALLVVCGDYGIQQVSTNC